MIARWLTAVLCLALPFAADAKSHRKHQRRPVPAAASPAPASDDGGRIIGGTIAPANSNQWQVEIYWNADSIGPGASAQRNHQCGGSLIAPSWVVTAAHCFFDTGSNPPLYTPANAARAFKARVGTRSLDDFSDAVIFAIADVIVHPDYVSAHASRRDRPAFSNDIALVHLATPVPLTHDNRDRVRTIALDRSGTGPGALVRPGLHGATVTGWGSANNVDDAHPDPTARSATLGGMEPQLKVVALAIRPNTDCPGIPATHFCAGAANADACVGDSGGPAAWKGDDGFVLLGIVSAGNTAACGRAGSPTVYTQVTQFIPWIEANMAKFNDRLAQ